MCLICDKRKIEAENAQLKAAIDDSVRAHRAQIDELKKQVAEYVCVEMERDQLKAELEQCQDELRIAERALRGKGYRKSCDIPACNCGDQWNHGGNADTRLREISDALPYVNGKTILARVQDVVEALAQATQREARLREALTELYALVRGECPRLLNEDSGGDAELACKIDAALEEAGT